MSKLLCIYHANCDDGFGAALALWKFQPDTEFFAGVYGGRLPNVAGRDVVLVDFCYPSATMVELAKQAKSIFVLDHHVSAMEDMISMFQSIPQGQRGEPNSLLTHKEANEEGMERIVSCVLRLRNLTAHFDMKRSGAMMAWNRYYPDKEPPKFIQYIQDRDLWTKALPDIDAFTMGLRSMKMDFEMWNLLIDGPQNMDTLIEQGKHILRYHNLQVEQAVKHSYWVNIEVPGQGPLQIRGANVAPALSSDVGEALANQYGGIGITWTEGYRGFIYSLRSRGKDGPDVSKIAFAFGGGGHKAAAGFKSDVAIHNKAAHNQGASA